MTDALDRAATAAHNAWMVSTESLTEAPGAQQIWRVIAAAALRVMADDILTDIDTCIMVCQECDLAQRIPETIKRYIGDSNEK